MTETNAIVLIGVLISIALGVSGIFPRLKKDFVDALVKESEAMRDQVMELRAQVTELREQVRKCEERDRRKGEIIRWLQNNSALKAGAKPMPRFLHDTDDEEY